MMFEEEEVTRRFHNCCVCEKQFEIPLHAPADYGWYIGDRHFCTYTHMRDFERDPGKYNGKRPTGKKSMNTTFDRLIRFMDLREKRQDISAPDAAAIAGFPSYIAASSAKNKYQKREDFLEYRQAHGDRA